MMKKKNIQEDRVKEDTIKDGKKNNVNASVTTVEKKVKTQFNKPELKAAVTSHIDSSTYPSVNSPQNGKYDEFDISFEKLSTSDEHHSNYWYARDLQQLFEYTYWTEFERVITRAQLACENGGNDIKSHFILTTRPLEVFGVKFKEVQDYKLSRFATYLIIQNSDPKYKVVAQAQSYFASKVRSSQLEDISKEDIKRVEMRRYLKEENTKLSKIARKSGVTTSDEFSDFYNRGYQGLYGGLSVKEIHERKGLDEDEKVLDFMSSPELAANLFRVTQTQEILKKQNIDNPQVARDIHFNVGHSIRKTIKEMGGVPPEHLQTPSRDVSKILLSRESESDKKNSRKKSSKLSSK